MRLNNMFQRLNDFPHDTMCTNGQPIASALVMYIRRTRATVTHSTLTYQYDLSETKKANPSNHYSL